MVASQTPSQTNAIIASIVRPTKTINPNSNSEIYTVTFSNGDQILYVFNSNNTNSAYVNYGQHQGQIDAVRSDFDFIKKQYLESQKNNDN